MKVVAIFVIATIVFHVVSQLHRSNNIEVEFKLSTALGKEIILNRTLEVAFIICSLVCYTIK